MEKNENNMNSGKRRGGGSIKRGEVEVLNFLNYEEHFPDPHFIFSTTEMNDYGFPDPVINFIRNNWIRIGDRNGGTYVKFQGLSDDRVQQIRDQFEGGRRRKRKSRRKKRRRKSRKKRKTKRRRKRKTRKRR